MWDRAGFWFQCQLRYTTLVLGRAGFPVRTQGFFGSLPQSESAVSIGRHILNERIESVAEHLRFAAIRPALVGVVRPQEEIENLAVP